MTVIQMLVILQKLSIIAIPIFFGYLLRKKIQIPTNKIAKLFFLILMPYVSFFGILKHGSFTEISKIGVVYLIVIALALAIANLISSRLAINKNEKPLLLFSSINGNIAYLGIPVTLLVIGESGLPILITLILLSSIVDATVNTFIFANSGLNVVDTFKKIFKSPLVYAVFFAFLLKNTGIDIPPMFFETYTFITCIISILGQLILGSLFAEISVQNKLNPALVYAASFQKLFLMPAIGVVVCWLLGDINPTITKTLLLAFAMPMPINTVFFATFFEKSSQESAALVIITSVLSIISLPVIILFLSNSDLFA